MGTKHATKWRIYCKGCGQEKLASRQDAKTCSSRCRMVVSRRRKRAKAIAQVEQLPTVRRPAIAASKPVDVAAQINKMGSNPPLAPLASPQEIKKRRCPRCQSKDIGRANASGFIPCLECGHRFKPEVAKPNQPGKLARITAHLLGKGGKPDEQRKASQD